LAQISVLALFMAGLLPRLAIALQPIHLQLDKMLPDDAYYYFLTAKNILEVGSPSVDGLNPSNGWHPLWMLVNLGIFALPTSNPDAPIHLILVLGAILDGLVVVILFYTLSKYVSLSAAVVGAGLYAINAMPMFQSVNGLETALVALMLAATWTTSLRLIENPSRRWAFVWGLTFGLTFLARTDTAVVLFWLGLYVLACLKGRTRWIITASGAVVASMTIAPWLVWNQINFGSAFVQVSGVAVPWAVQTRFQMANPGEPLWQLSLKVLTDPVFWLRGDYLGAPPLMGFILWPAGLLGLWWSWRRGWVRLLMGIGGLLLVGCLCLVFIHTALRWYPRPWYFVVMAQALSLGVAFFWHLMSHSRLKFILISAMGIGVIFSGVLAWQIGYYPWQRSRMYDAALWVKDSTPEESIVASMNSGIIGYYSDRTTINLDGVVNPQAFAASQQGRLMDYILESEIDYFLDFDNAVLNEYGPFMGPNFQERLIEVAQIGEAYPGLGHYRVYLVSTNTDN